MKVSCMATLAVFLLLARASVAQAPAMSSADKLGNNIDTWMSNAIKESRAQADDDMDFIELLHYLGKLINGQPVDPIAEKRLIARANSDRSAKVAFHETKDERRDLAAWLARLNEQVKNGNTFPALRTKIESLEHENESLSGRDKVHRAEEEAFRTRLDVLEHELELLKKSGKK